jgi:thiamine biosynthesis protein ThiS
MNVIVNGNEEYLPDMPLTLTDIVRKKGIKPQTVVIEVNLDIIQRIKWDDTFIKNDDRIEIVSFVGGGSNGRLS